MTEKKAPNGLAGLAMLGAASVVGLGAVYLVKTASRGRDRRSTRAANRIISELHRLERRAERRLKRARRDEFPAIIDGANSMWTNANSALSQLANIDWRPYYDRIPHFLDRFRRG
jgi:hypothetical protein